MNAGRSYVMKARADAVADTRRRILRSIVDLGQERLTMETTLDDVAERAGVSVRTILRHFGSREGLLDAAWEFGRTEVVEERIAPPGDLDAAVRVLFDSYERRGDVTLRLLGQEFWDERIRHGMDLGRRSHREWVETVFAPQLGERPAEHREALTDLLVVASDVYTWKLLRRDRKLNRDAAEDRVRQMLTALLAVPAEGP
jgi:AcrR family transcriptional regulator